MTSDEHSYIDGVADEEEEVTIDDMIYQPNAKMKYSGHRNSRLFFFSFSNNPF